MKTLLLAVAVLAWAPKGAWAGAATISPVDGSAVVLSSGSERAGIVNGSLKTRDDSSVVVGAATTSVASLIAGYNDDGTSAVPSVSEYYAYKSMHTNAITRAAYDTYEGRMFSAVFESNITGTAEVNFILAVNLSTNTKNLILNRLVFNVADNSAVGTLRAYINPVVTSSGTPVAIGNRNTVFASSPSKMQIYSSPVTSAAGAKIGVYGAGSGTTFVLEAGYTIVIGPGYKVLFTVQNTVTNKSDSLQAIWAEQ